MENEFSAKPTLVLPNRISGCDYLLQSGLLEDRAFSGVLFNYPLQAKREVVSQVVNFFTEQYESACTTLSGLDALKWTLECIGTSFSLPVPQNAEIVSKAIEIYRIWLRAVWRRPPCIETHLEFVTREISLHVASLFIDIDEIKTCKIKAFLCQKALELISFSFRSSMFYIGSLVEAKSLQKLPHLNGKRGVVVGYGDLGRVLVEFESTGRDQSQQKTSLRTSNLKMIEEGSSALSDMFDSPKLPSYFNVYGQTSVDNTSFTSDPSVSESNTAETPLLPESHPFLVKLLMEICDHLLSSEYGAEPICEREFNGLSDFAGMSRTIPSHHSEHANIPGLSLACLFEGFLHTAAVGCDEDVEELLWKILSEKILKWKEKPIFAAQWSAWVEGLTVALQPSLFSGLGESKKVPVVILWHRGSSRPAFLQNRLSEKKLFELWRRSVSLLSLRVCDISSKESFFEVSKGLRKVALLLCRAGWYSQTSNSGVYLPLPSPSCTSVSRILQEWCTKAVFCADTKGNGLLRTVFAVQSLCDMYLRPHPGQVAVETVKPFYACLLRLLKQAKSGLADPSLHKAPPLGANTQIYREEQILGPIALFRLALTATIRTILNYDLPRSDIFCEPLLDYLKEVLGYTAHELHSKPVQDARRTTLSMNSSLSYESDDEEEIVSPRRSAYIQERYFSPIRRDAATILAGLIGRCATVGNTKASERVTQLLLVALSTEKHPPTLSQLILLCTQHACVYQEACCLLTEQVALLLESRHPVCVYQACLEYLRCVALQAVPGNHSHHMCHLLRGVQAVLRLVCAMLAGESGAGLSNPNVLDSDESNCPCYSGLCTQPQSLSMVGAFSHLTHAELEFLGTASLAFVREAAFTGCKGLRRLPELPQALRAANNSPSTVLRAAGFATARSALLSSTATGHGFVETSLTEETFSQDKVRFFSVDGSRILSVIWHSNVATTDQEETVKKVDGGVTLIIRDSYGRHAWQAELILSDSTTQEALPDYPTTDSNDECDSSDEEISEIPPGRTLDELLSQLLSEEVQSALPAPDCNASFFADEEGVGDGLSATSQPISSSFVQAKPKKIDLAQLFLASLQFLPLKNEEPQVIPVRRERSQNIRTVSPQPASPDSMSDTSPPSSPPIKNLDRSPQKLERGPSFGVAIQSQLQPDTRLIELADTPQLRSSLRMFDITPPREVFRIPVLYLHPDEAASKVSSMGIEWYTDRSSASASDRTLLPTLPSFMDFVSKLGKPMEATEHPDRYHGGAAAERFRRRKLHYYSDSRSEAAFPVSALTPSALKSTGEAWIESALGGSQQKWEDTPCVRIVWNDTKVEYNPTGHAPACGPTKQLADVLHNFSPHESKTLDIVITPLSGGCCSVRIALPLANERWHGMLPASAFLPSEWHAPLIDTMVLPLSVLPQLVRIAALNAVRAFRTKWQKPFEELLKRRKQDGSSLESMTKRLFTYAPPDTTRNALLLRICATCHVASDGVVSVPPSLLTGSRVTASRNIETSNGKKVYSGEKGCILRTVGGGFDVCFDNGVIISSLKEGGDVRAASVSVRKPISSQVMLRSLLSS